MRVMIVVAKLKISINTLFHTRKTSLFISCRMFRQSLDPPFLGPKNSKETSTETLRPIYVRNEPYFIRVIIVPLWTLVNRVHRLVDFHFVVAVVFVKSPISVSLSLSLKIDENFYRIPLFLFRNFRNH